MNQDHILEVLLPQSGIVCSELVCEILKWLVYIRQQAPSPFDELLKEVKAPTKQRKFISSMNSLLESQQELFVKIQVYKIAILFGNTVTNPKETYILDFEHPQELDSVNDPKLLKQFERNLFQQLTMFIADAVANEIAPTKMWFFVLSKRETESQHFCPKQNFAIKPNWKPVTICFKQKNTAHVDQEDLVWFQSNYMIPGFATTSSSNSEDLFED
mmetsp:Transcript_2186/g.2897  ORF Transcript_2186/g.2897 Transcript_2186/m.2897 type:complete len:215 (+) Transcript_2186:41-685(+)